MYAQGPAVGLIGLKVSYSDSDAHTGWSQILTMQQDFSNCRIVFLVSLPSIDEDKFRRRIGTLY